MFDSLSFGSAVITLITGLSRPVINSSGALTIAQHKYRGDLKKQFEPSGKVPGSHGATQICEAREVLGAEASWTDERTAIQDGTRPA